jgi:hypothetical protein
VIAARDNDVPSTNGANGRTKGGKFAKGNKGGPGNPYVKHLAELRAMFHAAVTPERFKAATEALISRAEKGDVMAYRELCDRLFGKSRQPIEVGGKDGGKMRIEVVYVRRHRQHARD